MSQIPNAAIERLKKILDMLPYRSSESRDHVERISNIYGCAISSVYRELEKITPRETHVRKDKGLARSKDQEEFIGWVEIVAAIKHRSMNKKEHHISTTQAIYMAERGFRDIGSG